MTLDEIKNIIKTSKKYSSPDNFIFKYDYLIYITNGNEYRISFYDGYSKLTFDYSIYKHGMRSVKVYISKKYDEKKILSKFGEFIRYMNKMDKALSILNEQTNKVTPFIHNFIKNEYGLNDSIFKLDSNNFIRLIFPKTTTLYRRRARKTDFDIRKEKLDNIKFNVYCSFEEGNFICSLKFYFDYKDNLVTLYEKEERYKSTSKDITRIIRNEKLKNIMSNE